MLKILQKTILIVICLAVLFLIANISFAADLEVGLGYGQETGLGNEDIRVTIASIIQVALGFLGIIAVVIIIYGGFLFMKSKHDPEKIQVAKKVILSAAGGLVLILVAFSLTSYILTKMLEATGVEYGEAPSDPNSNVNIDLGGNGDLPGNGGDGLTQTIGQQVFNLNITQPESYDLELDINSLYSYAGASANFDALGPEFSDVLQPARTITFIYEDISDPQDKKVYLLNVHDKRYSGYSGRFAGKITNANDDFEITLRDDGGRILSCDEPLSGDSYADCGDTIKYNNVWATCCTDGEAIYLGDGSQPINFTLTVDSFIPRQGNASQTPSVGSWYVFTPNDPQGIFIADEYPASVDINIDLTN